MRVFLKHTKTGYFYGGSFVWVAESADAADFQNIEKALRAIIQDNLDGMSLVIRYDEHEADQVFDLSKDVPRLIPVEEEGSGTRT